MARAPAPSSAPNASGSPPGSSWARKHLATLLGLFIALTAVAAYFLFFLEPPAPARPTAVARLTTVEGNVRVKATGGNDWAKGRPSQDLMTGDIVQTDPSAGAEITFFTGNVVRVRPDSVVLISQGEAAVAEEATAWRIESGQVNFELKKETDIVTATARTRAAANSTGNINVTDEGGTGVKIFRGSAQVTTKHGDTVSLNDNQAVLVDAGGKAGSRIELPPTPRPIAPPGKAELPYVDPPQATTKLQWEPVHGAQTYRVAMDYNVHQAELLLSAALDQPGIAATTHELPGLDPGSYFWRVAGVSKEGLEGDFSRVSLFSVVKPPAPEPSPAGAPSLTTDAAAAQEGIVHVRGRTEPGASVTVDGHAVKVLPDGSFSEFVRTSGQGFVLVRATNANGQITEQKRPVAAY
ncbi:MAG TPA: hypothetical protein VGN09_14110 [Vicinamibacteria bacterium]